MYTILVDNNGVISPFTQIFPADSSIFDPNTCKSAQVSTMKFDVPDFY